MSISSACSPTRTRVTVLWWSAPCTLIDALEPALPLRDVVCDVRHEVRRLAALLGAAAHDAILVVAEVGGLEPERAVLLVRVAGRDQALDRLFDAAVRVQRRLEEIHVELDAERLEIEVLLRAQFAHRELPHRVEIVGRGIGRVFVDVALCEISNVLAVIAALGERDLLSAELAHARLDAQREIRDLRAGVVVIELSRHPPAGRAEQRADRVAERSLSAVANVQRPRWIRRYEFHVDGALLAGVRTTVLISRRDQRTKSLGEDVRGNTKIDEPRARDLRRLDSSASEVEAFDDCRREIAGLSPHAFREDHRQIRRPIAERGIARTFDDWRDVIGRAE